MGSRLGRRRLMSLRSMGRLLLLTRSLLELLLHLAKLLPHLAGSPVNRDDKPENQVVQKPGKQYIKKNLKHRATKLPLFTLL